MLPFDDDAEAGQLIGRAQSIARLKDLVIFVVESDNGECIGARRASRGGAHKGRSGVGGFARSDARQPFCAAFAFGSGLHGEEFSLALVIRQRVDICGIHSSKLPGWVVGLMD